MGVKDAALKQQQEKEERGGERWREGEREEGKELGEYQTFYAASKNL